MNSKFKIQNSKLIVGKSGFAVLVLLFAAFCLPLTVNAQKSRSINEVQGDKNVSPFVNEQAKLSGIVTARTRTGFFLQTPDDKTDNNPATSEGIFVYTKTEPGGEAAIGNLISVTGTVLEFRPKAEPMSLPITELSFFRDKDRIAVESKGNPLPKPVVLTADDFKSGVIDALEKYEGMRVEVKELTVVAPTGGRIDDKNGTADSNGTFTAF
jgi:predicted extracellular nuclease